ncbi:putative chitinase 2 [Amphibalanus amphitrite]|uniref:Putative chitinase 2 n=1 Tax=Amphibalanus amphitrite TaxID=1232801 RepID=A0A6A4X7M9_AMPAM|nr:probable chitinase 2 [Amphibalanus amphitrite]KAF0312024.1 putative chitinase 2 [Amphibalanus amphitrite]
MRGACVWRWCAALLTLISLRGCTGDRFAPSTLREYLRSVVKDTLDQHYADLNSRLDRIEASLERIGQTGGSGLQIRSASRAPHVVCNVASWASFRSGRGKFTIDNIDIQACTHLVYQYVGMDETSNELRSLNPTLDLGSFGNPSGGNYARFTSLKKLKPSLKTIISVGGYLEGSEKFSNMAQDPAKRAKFVASVMEFLQKHNFDGLDMNWQHPTQRGGTPQDRTNFPVLLEELREAFRPRSWLLMASLSALTSIADAGYDVPRISSAIDLLHMQGFDYHGVWDRRTGHNAPLDRVSGSVNYYLRMGADASKLLLGIPLYGSSYLLTDPTRSDVGAPAAETAFKGPYTQLDGSIGYNELCEMRAEAVGAERWTKNWDDVAKVPYFVQDTRWVSIEDERSVTHKAALVQRFRLAGVALTTLDTDDFNGVCGQKNVLMSAIITELKK